MKQAIVQTYTFAQEYRANITLVLTSTCILMIAFYALNIYTVISRTVSLEHVRSNIASVTGSINTLDARYLELSSDITPDALASHGLAEGKVSFYIQRAVSTASLGTLAQAGHEL